MAWGDNSNAGAGFGGFDNNPGALTNAPQTQQNDKPGFSSWAGDLFGSLGTIGTAYFNSKAGYPTGQVGFYDGGGYNGYPQQRKNPNMILYIVGAIVLIVLLYLFTKK